jgi:hypothetical protein
MERSGRIDSLPYERAFVVQFGVDADVAAGPVVGRAEHLASGRSARFASWEELLRFVASCAGEPGS